MNKSVLYTSFLFLALLAQALDCRIYAQNDEIKKRSRENQGGGGSDDGCAAGCLADGCLFLIDYAPEIAELLVSANKAVLEKEPEIPRLRSIELSAMGGFFSSNNTIIIPRLRLNYGLFTTDFRMYKSLEAHLDRSSNITTLDWQVLMLNVVPLKPVNLRIGSGFIFEDYSGDFFNEHTANLDIYPTDRLKLNAEYRIAPDYRTGMIVRQEFDAGVYFAFFKKKDFKIYGFANYFYADFYEGIIMDTFTLGISLNLE